MKSVESKIKIAGGKHDNWQADEIATPCDALSSSMIDSRKREHPAWRGSMDIDRDTYR